MSYIDSLNNILNNINDNINNNKIPIMDILDIKKLPDVPFIDNLPNFNNLPFISNGVLYNYPDITPFIQLDNYKFLLNIIRSPIAPPEKKYDAYLTSLSAAPIHPTSLDLFQAINYNNAVKLQVGPTCAANSTATVKEYQAFLKNNYSNTFSPDYIYLHRSNQNTDGMMLENAMNILQNKGACPTKNFPNGITNIKNIPSSAIIAATPYKINTYAAIYQKVSAVDKNPVSTIDKLKTALYLHGPCLIAFLVYNNHGILNNGVYDGRIWIPQNSSQKSLGGHCMTVVGYDINKGFIIRNSWGTTWNGNGHSWLPYSDFGTVNEPLEIWTATDLFPIIYTPQSTPIFTPTPSTINDKLVHLIYLSLIIIPVIIIIIIIYINRS
jgi:hypothetical protein